MSVLCNFALGNLKVPSGREVSQGKVRWEGSLSVSAHKLGPIFGATRRAGAHAPVP